MHYTLHYHHGRGQRVHLLLDASRPRLGRAPGRDAAAGLRLQGHRGQPPLHRDGLRLGRRAPGPGGAAQQPHAHRLAPAQPRQGPVPAEARATTTTTTAATTTTTTTAATTTSNDNDNNNSDDNY